ncbi:MAG: ArsR/SmtB family transcription factor [Candidatus Bipolaricaulia bacterium]
MDRLVKVAKALSDESRLRALGLLEPGELCLCHLIEVIGLAPSTMSKHMQLLVDAGLVQQRKAGRWRYYRLAGTGAPVEAHDALAWVRASLRQQPRVEADLRHREEALSRDVDELTACYRN